MGFFNTRAFCLCLLLLHKATSTEHLRVERKLLSSCTGSLSITNLIVSVTVTCTGESTPVHIKYKSSSGEGSQTSDTSVLGSEIFTVTVPKEGTYSFYMCYTGNDVLIEKVTVSASTTTASSASTTTASTTVTSTVTSTATLTVAVTGVTGSVLPDTYTCLGSDSGHSPPLTVTCASSLAPSQLILLMSTEPPESTTAAPLYNFNWVFMNMKTASLDSSVQESQITYSIPENQLIYSNYQTSLGFLFGCARKWNDDKTLCQNKYISPCAKGCGSHAYTFTVYALSESLTLDSDMSGQLLKTYLETGTYSSLVKASGQVTLTATHTVCP